MKCYLFIFLILAFGCQSTSKELPVLSYKIDDKGEKIDYSITYEDFINQLNNLLKLKKEKP